MAAVAGGYGHSPFRPDASRARTGARSDHLSRLEPSLEQVHRSGCRRCHDHLRWWRGRELSGSWVSPGPKTCWSGEWHIECTTGEIVWTSRDDTAPDHVTIRPLGKRAHRFKLPALELTDRRGSLQAFVRAVQTGQEPECSGRDNLHSLALMYAAVESATSHVPVSLTTPS